MKKSSSNKLKAGGRHAFTLVELLVVLGCVALLSVVLLSLAFTSQANALRAQCTSNLRQIGVGWSMYNSENNALMPCNWPGVCVDNVVGAGSASSPWRTYEIERVVPGTGIMGTGDGTTTSGLPIPQTMSGWWNLGKLWPNRFVSDPRLFYCPSGVPPIAPTQFTYAYYTAPNANPPQPWPTTAAAQTGENEIRMAYNYFPQSRTLQVIGGRFLGPVPAVTLGGLDVTKCIVTDQMSGYDSLSHRADGVSGANALFPDGHVKWESAKANPAAFNLTSSGPYFWGQTGQSGSIGESTGGGITTFRYVKANLPP